MSTCYFMLQDNLYYTGYLRSDFLEIVHMIVQWNICILVFVLFIWKKSVFDTYVPGAFFCIVMTVAEYTAGNLVSSNVVHVSKGRGVPESMKGERGCRWVANSKVTIQTLQVWRQESPEEKQSQQRLNGI